MFTTAAQVVHSVSKPSGEDFAVVKLDRPVSQFNPLTFRTSGKVSVGDDLHVIGYPSGLPLKVAGGASVRAVQPEYLVANLDTYGGKLRVGRFQFHHWRSGRNPGARRTRF